MKNTDVGDDATIAPENLHARLVAAVKTKILQWEFPPGYRLLEQDVCDEYHVSRSPAREALRTLVADDYLEKMPRKGYLVRQPDPGKAREMYEVRLALELFVVEYLTSKGTADQRLDALTEAWGATEDCSGVSSEEFAEMDRRFHETFATILGNETLIRQLRSIGERLHAFRIIEFQNENTRLLTCRQHLNILAAVRNGDVDAARDAVRTNIETAIQNVEEVIKEALARSYIKESQGDSWRR